MQSGGALYPEVFTLAVLWTLVVLWGAIWGSFANVVIARVPRGMSVVYPASHCPHCETPIRWFDNLPVVSWLWLRGRCRACGAGIAVRYPLVECAGIVFSVAAFVHASGGFDLWRLETSFFEVLWVWMALTYFQIALLCLTLIDLEHTILPHPLTLGVALLGFAHAVIGPSGGDFRGFVPSLSALDSLIGFTVAYGLFFLCAYGYRLVTGRYGMGGGDFVLFGALGAWFGWESLPALMALASVQGVLAFALAPRFFPHLIQDASSDAFWEEEAPGATFAQPSPAGAAPEDGTEAPMDTSSVEALAPAYGIPFGPFLCLAAIEYLYLGEYYLRWLWGA